MVTGQSDFSAQFQNGNVVLDGFGVPVLVRRFGGDDDVLRLGSVRRRIQVVFPNAHRISVNVISF